MHPAARRSQFLVSSALNGAVRAPAGPLCPSVARPAFSLSFSEQRRHRWFSSTDSTGANNPQEGPEAGPSSSKPAADRPQAADAPAASDANAGGKEAAKPIDPLEALKEKHTEEIRLIKNQLLTSMADFQNLQRRSERDAKSAKEFAVQAFAKDLVGDLDVLTLALSSVPEGKRNEESDLKTLYDGVSLTATTLEKTLKRHGVVSFDPMGEVFNPNDHEAVYQAPIPGKTPGTVFDVQKKGWKVGSRLLRPAQVGVVRAQD